MARRNRSKHNKRSKQQARLTTGWFDAGFSPMTKLMAIDWAKTLWPSETPFTSFVQRGQSESMKTYRWGTDITDYPDDRVGPES